MKTQSAKVWNWHATPNFHICMIAYMRSAHVFHHVIHMFRVHTCVYACNSFLHWWLDFMTVQKIKSRKITKFSLPWAAALPKCVMTCWFKIFMATAASTLTATLVVKLRLSIALLSFCAMGWLASQAASLVTTLVTTLETTMKAIESRSKPYKGKAYILGQSRSIQ